MSEYYQRTLDIKRRVLQRPDLIEIIKLTFEGRNNNLVVDSEASANRLVYGIGIVKIGGITLLRNRFFERRLYLALKKFRENPCFNYKYRGFNPDDIRSWDNSIIVGEAHMFELYFSQGMPVPYFQLVVNHRGELATLTEDLNKGKKRALRTDGPHYEFVYLDDRMRKVCYVDLKHELRTDKSYPLGIKYLQDEARLDVV